MDTEAFGKEFAAQIVEAIHAERRAIWKHRADTPVSASTPEDRAVDAVLLKLQELFQRLAPARPILRPSTEKPAAQLEIIVRGTDVAVDGEVFACLSKAPAEFLTLTWNGSSTQPGKPRGQINRTKHSVTFDEFSIVESFYNDWLNAKRKHEAYHASQAELAKPAQTVAAASDAGAAKKAVQKPEATPAPAPAAAA
jgi:hypothetical protein